MTGLNSLKHAFKGVKTRVEHSDVKLVPVDSNARRVIQPAPWWAKPIPEAASKTVEELQAKVVKLEEALNELRKHAGKQDVKMQQLREALSERDKALARVRAQKDALEGQLMKLLGLGRGG